MARKREGRLLCKVNPDFDCDLKIGEDVEAAQGDFVFS